MASAGPEVFMVTRGLLARLDVKPGKDPDVEAFLNSGLELVRQEPATTAWFAIRFGRSEYGIFDVFPDDAGRDAHLTGAVARALMSRADELFTETPRIQKLDVLASKLPADTPLQADTKGLLLTFKAQAGNDFDVEEFLREAQPIVQDEPETTAWFAIRLDDGQYGIFDVFPDNGGRFKHLTGHVPRELAKHALTLLGSMPHMEMLDVLAEKLGG
jgi:quinol monooxygenase YgiN